MSAAALVGWTLVVGSVAFGVGAGNPALMRAWTAPRDEFLRIVADRPGAWRLSVLLFMFATVTVAAGLAAIPILLADDVARSLAVEGAVAFAFASVLWLATLVHRLAVISGTARSFVERGVVDPAGEPLDRLMGGFFKVFIVVGSAGVAAIGIALAAGGLAPGVVGWGAAGLSVLLVIGLFATGDMPPFTLYLAPLAFGIALLLR